jgi:hypothetical protein
MKPINYVQIWTCKLDRLRNLISVDNSPTFFLTSHTNELIVKNCLEFPSFGIWKRTNMSISSGGFTHHNNFLGKVHLTPSNYYLNDNLPLKLSITTIYPSNYQNNDNVPPNASKMMKLPL